jgi:hypothetical protein
MAIKAKENLKNASIFIFYFSNMPNKSKCLIKLKPNKENLFNHDKQRNKKQFVKKYYSILKIFLNLHLVGSINKLKFKKLHNLKTVTTKCNNMKESIESLKKCLITKTDIFQKDLT